MVIEHAQSNLLKTLEEPGCASVFKVVREKLVQLILKDTNNAVRDAAVQLLILFKQRLMSD